MMTSLKIGLYIVGFILTITVIGLGVLYNAVDSIPNGSETTAIYKINDTKIYVTKKQWGMAGGHELTVVSPHSDTTDALVNGNYNPNFDGLICYTTDTQTVIKDDSLIIYCSDAYRPLEQNTVKVWQDITVSLL